ncbi:histidine-histamine antiporter, partial [Enterobacter asburiae]
FYCYCCLSFVALCFITLALMTESSATVVWGIVLQLATLPLYLFYIARRHRQKNDVSETRPTKPSFSNLSKELS